MSQPAPYYTTPSLSEKDTEWCSNCGGGNYAGKCVVTSLVYDSHIYNVGDCLHCGAPTPFLSTKVLPAQIVGGKVKYLLADTPIPVEPQLRQKIADDLTSIRAHAERLGLKL